MFSAAKVRLNLLATMTNYNHFMTNNYQNVLKESVLGHDEGNWSGNLGSELRRRHLCFLLEGTGEVGCLIVTTEESHLFDGEVLAL